MFWQFCKPTSRDLQRSVALDLFTNMAAATAQKAPSKTYIKYLYIIALNSWFVAAGLSLHLTLPSCHWQPRGLVRNKEMLGMHAASRQSN